MKFSTRNGLEFAQFEKLAGMPGLLHAVTTRSGGASGEPFNGLNLGAAVGDSDDALARNYALLAGALDFDLQRVITSHQVHGAEIACVEKAPERDGPFPFGHALQGYDGFITAVPGIPLMVRVADCVPVLLYDPDTRVLAVVHAGWRGTAAGIAGKAACRMADRYGCEPGRIIAGIGPSIGPCCYEVGQDVADHFQGYPEKGRVLIQEGPASFALDLQQANALQLVRAGLAPGNVELSWLCTACNLHLFFSHRGEQGKTGRFALIAGLRA